MSKGRIKSGFAADDGVALHFVGNKLAKVVSSRKPAMAYRVASTKSGIEESIIKPVFLGEQ
jgi:peptidase E